MRPLGWALGATLAFATQAAALDWEHRFYPAEVEGDLAVCTAGVHYADGPFVLRIYDETVDFYLEDDELALPPERTLGTVVFVFDDLDFVLAADSGWTEDGGPVDHLFLTPRGDDVALLFERLRARAEMDIVFPDGLAYTIGLDGSWAALFEAFECWRREATGAMAPEGRNPFAAADEPGRNPFR